MNDAVRRWLPPALLLGVMGLAVAVRVPWLAHGYSADEVGLLVPGGFVGQFTDPETGVNPPAYRWLLLPFDRAAALFAGRRLSLVANVLAVGCVGAVVRRAAGSWLAGLAAAVALAVHPASVEASTTARPYGLFSLVTAVHLATLVRWLGAPSRAAAVAVALTAAALPWVHYMAVPWLLVVGVGVAVSVPAARRLPLLYAPAALGFLPLLRAIVTQTSRREPPLDPVGVVLEQVISLGLSSRGSLLWGSGRPSLAQPSLAALAVLAVVALTLVRARHLAPAARALAWSVAGLLAAVTLLAQGQAVRPPTASMMATVAIPWLVVTVASLPRRAALPVAVALAVVLGRGVVERTSATQGEVLERDAIRTVAGRLRDGTFPAGDLAVLPMHDTLPLFYYLSGAYISDAVRDGRCGSDPSCFRLQDRVVRARSVLSASETPWVVAFGTKPAVPCPEHERGPGYVIGRCPVEPPTEP